MDGLIFEVVAKNGTTGRIRGVGNDGQPAARDCAGD